VVVVVGAAVLVVVVVVEAVVVVAVRVVVVVVDVPFGPLGLLRRSLPVLADAAAGCLGVSTW
jgi:hypothetical protein